MADRRDRSRSREKQDDPNKLYIDIFNIPEHHNKEDIVYFLWKTLEKANALKKHTNPIVKSEYLSDLNCIRVFLRSREQTLNCLDLNGIYYGEKAFYMKSPLSMRELPQINLTNIRVRALSGRTEDGFNKLCIQNLPVIQEYEIVNLLGRFGELKSFQTVYSGKILSHCFFEYRTNEETEECLAKLNNEKVRSKAVSVKRAALASGQAGKSVIGRKSKSLLFQKDLQSFYLTFDTTGFFKTMKISCILLLRNIISGAGDREFIRQDVRRELGKIGAIGKTVTKEKNLYVQFERVEYAQIAFLLMMNRKYEGKGIDVAFYDALNFADDILI